MLVHIIRKSRCQLAIVTVISVYFIAYSFFFTYFREGIDPVKLGALNGWIRSAESDDTVMLTIDGKNSSLKFNSTRQPNLGIHVVDVLTRGQGESLAERLTLRNATDRHSMILIWEDTISDNLDACRDWGCQITRDKSEMAKADAVIFDSTPYELRQLPNQYFIYYSQESPAYSNHFNEEGNGYFNMTLGFRLDSPAASPYGFTARLSKESRRSWADVRASIQPIVAGKTRAVAWFVSHCSTSSKREVIATALQKVMEVDIYGACGTLSCPRSGSCEGTLNTDYFFYFAAENSICTDYITEKLWSQGFNYTIVPIVLRRRVYEGIAPPNSFIAVDDFENAVQMAEHLQRLMIDKKLYMEYFRWRTDYETIILKEHSEGLTKRMWGFCQICRLTRMSQRPHYEIGDMRAHWDASCEDGGKFADTFHNKTLLALEMTQRPSRVSKSRNHYHRGFNTARRTDGLNLNEEAKSVKSMWRLPA